MPEPKPRYVSTTLESITVRGKYKIPQTNFNDVSHRIKKALGKSWATISEIGESVELIYWSESKRGKLKDKDWTKYIEGIRSGIPIDLTITTVEHYNTSILVEVECRPTMWHRIVRSKGRETSFTENEVQEALFECKKFVKQVMSILREKRLSLFQSIQ